MVTRSSEIWQTRCLPHWQTKCPPYWQTGCLPHLLACGDEGIDELYRFNVFDWGGGLFAGSSGGDERIFDDFRLGSDDLTLRIFCGGREAGRPGEGAGTVVASGDLVAVIDGRIDG